MAIYRNVQMSFWTDRKIDEEFSSNEKYLYLFFLTNPMTNLCGCYEIGMKQIANMTGLDNKRIKATLKELQDTHRVVSYSEETRELLIVNWHKYNWTDSEKFRKPLLNEIEAVKDDVFRAYLLDIYNGIDTVSIPYAYGMDTTDAVTVTDTVSVNNINNKQNSKGYIDNPKVDEAIKTFIKYRKEIKKPMGDVSISRFVKRLVDLSQDPDEQIALIYRAIDKNWLTVYPNDKPRPKSRAPSFGDQREYNYKDLEKELLAKGRT